MFLAVVSAFVLLSYTPGEDGTYAQNYQDTWFERVAKHNGWLESTGFYLDLGAFKPFECSSTALLDIKHRWKVCSVSSLIASSTNFVLALLCRAFAWSLATSDLRGATACL